MINELIHWNKGQWLEGTLLNEILCALRTKLYCETLQVSTCFNTQKEPIKFVVKFTWVAPAISGNSVAAAHHLSTLCKCQTKINQLWNGESQFLRWAKLRTRQGEGVLFVFEKLFSSVSTIFQILLIIVSRFYFFRSRAWISIDYSHRKQSTHENCAAFLWMKFMTFHDTFWDLTQSSFGGGAFMAAVHLLCWKNWDRQIRPWSTMISDPVGPILTTSYRKVLWCLFLNGKPKNLIRYMDIYGCERKIWSRNP